MATIVFLLLLSLCLGTDGLIPYHKVVAKDGSGDFHTISDAILAAPSYSIDKYYIRVKEGIYPETLCIGEDKTNIQLVGDGVKTTIITGDRSVNEMFNLSDTSTLVIKGQGFVGVELTIRNTAGPSMDQAVALMVEAGQSAFYRCRFEGYQDTLYTKSGPQFFRECEVYGTVDFIFGSAAALFQHCSIFARIPRASQSNTITAHKGRIPNSKTGIVLQNCMIAAASDLAQHGLGIHTYLGRPWDSFSTTVIMNSYLTEAIDPSGWLNWTGRDLSQVFYAEYHNEGPGAKGRRVPWARTISHGEATKFTVRNFIEGEEWIPSTGIPFFLDLGETEFHQNKSLFSITFYRYFIYIQPLMVVWYLIN